MISNKDLQPEPQPESEIKVKRNIFFYIHQLLVFLFIILLIFIPLKYYKYIAWIPLVISFHWVIFNGCIFDYLHFENCNNNNIPTNNIIPILELFNKEFASYIDNNYLKNTLRPVFSTVFIYILILTIIIYRLIYNIEFFSYDNK